jgi:gamma-glutamylcyclotransferase (GGCT)/AIG2-like uncharacterized protein YtfP
MSRRLEGQALYLGTARVRGRLHDLGDYPVLIAAADPGEWVTGELYSLPAPRRILAWLDRYEGCAAARRGAFTRVRCDVFSRRAPPRPAWVYRYALPLVGAPRIESGDYLEPV